MDESANHPPPHRRPGRDPHPDPRPIDRKVDEQVRALLAAEPDPGPMPTAVTERIAASIAHEARLRVSPGPLAGRDADERPAAGPHDDHDTILSFAPPADRGRRLRVAGAVAAAALVVAAAGSALQLGSRPNGAALFGDGLASSSAGAGAHPRFHIQVSTTAYTPGTLAARARDLLDHPGTPLPDLAAESPAIGPIGTEVGLASCLSGLGIGDPPPDAVTADLATYAGRPAVVVVVSRGGSSTAWAVERSCSEGDPGVLHGATPIP